MAREGTLLHFPGQMYEQSAVSGKGDSGWGYEPRTQTRLSLPVLPAPHLLGNPLPGPEQMLQQQAVGRTHPSNQGPLGPAHPPLGPGLPLAADCTPPAQELRPKSHMQCSHSTWRHEPQNRNQCSPSAARTGTSWEARTKALLCGCEVGDGPLPHLPGL